MPKTTTLCDPKPERKGHSRIRAQHRSLIIIFILIHLLTRSPHVSLPHGTTVEIEQLHSQCHNGRDTQNKSIHWYPLVFYHLAHVGLLQQSHDLL